MPLSLFCCAGAKKVLDSFGGEFRSSQTKMVRKRHRVIYAHDSLHHLLPVQGMSAYIRPYILFCGD